ncbi:hypothetical protein GCM10018965_066730 [Nonomuraea roseola]
MLGRGSPLGVALGSALGEGSRGSTTVSGTGCCDGVARRVTRDLTVGMALVRVGVAVGVGRLDMLARGVAAGSEAPGEAALAGLSPSFPGQPLTESVVLENSPPITMANMASASTPEAMELTMTNRRRRPLWSTKTAFWIGAGPCCSGDTASDRSDG